MSVWELTKGRQSSGEGRRSRGQVGAVCDRGSRIVGEGGVGCRRWGERVVGGGGRTEGGGSQDCEIGRGGSE